MISETLSFNSQRNCVLKEDYLFVVADPAGAVRANEHGIYLKDTRFLRRYVWDLGSANQMLSAHSDRPDRYSYHYSLMRGPSQLAAFRRNLAVDGWGIEDCLKVENTGYEPIALSIGLEWEPDFSDLFIARGYGAAPSGSMETAPAGNGTEIEYRYRARDLCCVCGITLKGFQNVEAGSACAELTLMPGGCTEFSVRVDLRTDASGSGSIRGKKLPTYEDWEASFNKSATRVPERYSETYRTSVLDLRALLLSTEEGPYPAAGIPWYVAAFGRDAILTSYLLLPEHPELALGTLRFLARRQGKAINAETFEEPGKILHELRYGELTQDGTLPYSPNYGTVDATPLFLILLERYLDSTADTSIVQELRPAWEAALLWISEYGDRDGDGFVEHLGSDPRYGRMVQSWKDSADSMSHEDGSLAEGAIAAAEVQGYVYAAYLAAMRLYGILGCEEKAKEVGARAAALREDFDKSFWLTGKACYAMALDGDKRPLSVLSSNAAQLLWTGIVKGHRADPLMHTLRSPELWSGWGIRTLGKSERRYNPLSYHNGSVWPHDTALAALGMAAYGYREDAARIRDSLFDLAAAEPDRRLPELVGGYDRNANIAVPYPVACRPQAWDAAAIIALASLFPPAS